MSDKQIIPVKVDPALKTDFEWTCELIDSNVSQELRKLMRGLIKKEHDKALEGIVLSGETPDPVSGYNYDPRAAEDIRTVKRMIWLMRQFERLHPGEKLMPFQVREDRKRVANCIACDTNKTPQERAEGYLNVIRTYFSRSVMATLIERDPRSYRDHPGFETYVAHYLAAKKQGAADLEHQESIDLLSQRYPLSERLQIKGGSSYWEAGKAAKK